MNVILLSNLYPFSSKEVLIEKEIKYISTFFERVHVVGCQPDKNYDELRPLPSNVTASCTFVKKETVSKIINAIKGTSILLSKEKYIKEEIKKCKTIKQFISLCIFENISRNAFDNLCENQDFLNLVTKPFIVYSYWYYIPARIATLINDKYKSEYMVSRAHGYDLYLYRNKLEYLPYRTYFIQEFNRVFPCSKDGEFYMKQMHPEYKEKIETKYLGTYDYGYMESSDDCCFKIVTCSRVTSVKRLDRLVGTLKMLEESSISVKWEHYGDGDLLQKLKENADNSLKNINAEFHGYMKNDDVLKNYIKEKYDVFINISESEGLPVSIMEAISVGLPVIATDVGGTSEIINKECGLLIDKDFNNEDLLNSILFFIKIKNSELYQQMKQSCRKLWKNNFSADDNYLKFYENLKK